MGKTEQEVKGISGIVREVNDALGLRVIVDSVEECYQALSFLFQTWPPAQGIYEQGECRDWIEHPKPNGYQSIHTTVVCDDRLLEVQIRTQQMHDVAEYGAAAHWVYKKAGRSVQPDKTYVEQIAQLRQVFEDRRKR